jgi:hypothetical protein
MVTKGSHEKTTNPNICGATFDRISLTTYFPSVHARSRHTSQNAHANRGQTLNEPTTILNLPLYTETREKGRCTGYTTELFTGFTPPPPKKKTKEEEEEEERNSK